MCKKVYLTWVRGQILAQSVEKLTRHEHPFAITSAKDDDGLIRRIRNYIDRNDIPAHTPIRIA